MVVFEGSNTIKSSGAVIRGSDQEDLGWDQGQEQGSGQQGSKAARQEQGKSKARATDGQQKQSCNKTVTKNILQSYFIAL